MQRTIFLHAAAPLKPRAGEACNGCGVCCAIEPCPLGMLVSLRRKGRCARLEWDEHTGRYRCGLLEIAVQTRGLRRYLAPHLGRWVRRWIAAGVGCDCDAEIADPAGGQRVS